MRELSLFTGAGGGILGSKLLGWKTLGYVEWEEYPQKIIAQRIKDGIYDHAPIFTDVREFAQSGAARQYRGHIDVLTAGFPCQPFSVAGKQLAADDERNMWPATCEVISAVRPPVVYLENTPGLISTGYIVTVIRDLERMGYRVKPPLYLGADDVGAIHHRQRIWIYATDSKCDRARRKANTAKPVKSNQSVERLAEKRLEAANTEEQQSNGARPSLGEHSRPYDLESGDSDFPILHSDMRSQRGQGQQQKTLSRQCGIPWSEDIGSLEDIRNRSDIPEPLIWGGNDGVANRRNRTRAVGNGQVPLTMATAYAILSSEAYQ